MKLSSTRHLLQNVGCRCAKATEVLLGRVEMDGDMARCTCDVTYCDVPCIFCSVILPALQSPDGYE